MGRRTYTKEQITGKMKEAEVVQAKDQTVVVTCPTNDLDRKSGYT